MSQSAIPFTLDVRGGESALRQHVHRMNDASFLERSVVVPLSDTKTDGRGAHGLVATDSLGAVPPDVVANANNCTALGTTAFATNTIRAVPFLHNNGFRVQILGMVVTAGAANAKGRIAIYNCRDDLNGDMYPNTLLYETGEIDYSAASAKTGTPNIDLEEGRYYWATYLAGTAAATVNSLALGATDALVGMTQGIGNTMLTVAYNYQAMPGTFPAGAVVATTVCPMIYMTYARASNTLRTRVVPLFTNGRRAGYVLRRVSLLRGSTLYQNPSDYPTVVLTAQVTDGSGSRPIGSFDSRNNTLSRGTPFVLTGPSDIDLRLAANAVVELKVDQYGWPKRSVEDTSVQVDYLYAGG